MRKQHKISILHAKLNGKRIDKLSAANAMVFKKVIEATGTVGKQMTMLSTDVKALKAAVSVKPSSPNAKTSSTKSSTPISKVFSKPVPTNQSTKVVAAKTRSYSSIK